MPDKAPSAVSGFYDGIFRYYEAVNAFLTLGHDVYWRRKAAKMVLAAHPASCLDVCTGTGDLAVLIHGLSAGRIKVTGLDFNEPMLSKARKKVSGVAFLRGEAEALPFSDETFDALTISFATRNLSPGANDLTKYFSEFRRVLKPGGVFLNLETSRPGNSFIRLLFHTHVRLMTALVKALFPKTKAAYDFLAGTISAFYRPEELSDIILKAGFSKVEVHPLMFGAIAVHKAIK